MLVCTCFLPLCLCVSEVGASRADKAELQQQLCSSSHIMCRMSRTSAAVTLILRGSYHRISQLTLLDLHPSPQRCRHLASREPAPEPLTTTSAALLQLCSSDCLLEAYSMCVGYYVTKYTYQYNCSSLSLSVAVCRALSWQFV